MKETSEKYFRIQTDSEYEMQYVFEPETRIVYRIGPVKIGADCRGEPLHILAESEMLAFSSSCPPELKSWLGAMGFANKNLAENLEADTSPKKVRKKNA